MRETLCVVTRYFGGTKLGMGGLARAYAQVAANALELVPVKIKTHFLQIALEFEYTFENQVRHLLVECQGKIVNINYSASVVMIADIPASRLASFKKKIIELSNAHIIIRDL